MNTKSVVSHIGHHFHRSQLITICFKIVKPTKFGMLISLICLVIYSMVVNADTAIALMQKTCLYLLKTGKNKGTK